MLKTTKSNDTFELTEYNIGALLRSYQHVLCSLKSRPWEKVGGCFKRFSIVKYRAKTLRFTAMKSTPVWKPPAQLAFLIPSVYVRIKLSYFGSNSPEARGG